MLIPTCVTALSKLVGKENTRYAFNGICLQRKAGNPRAVVTDGRRALILNWNEPDAALYPPVDGIDPGKAVDGFSTILPADVLDRLARACPRHTPKPILQNIALDEPSANGTVKLAVTDLQKTDATLVTAIEGNYPPVDDCVPDYCEHVLRDGGIYPARYTVNGNAEPAARMNVGIDPLRGLLDAMSKAGAECATLTVPISEQRGAKVWSSRPIRLDAVTDDGKKLTGICMPSYRQQMADMEPEPAPLPLATLARAEAYRPQIQQPKKPLWQMTLAEATVKVKTSGPNFMGRMHKAMYLHRTAVAAATKEGLPVPPEVLAGYAVEPVPARKEPWQMTRAYYMEIAALYGPGRTPAERASNTRAANKARTAHRVAVQCALLDGEEVPAAVMADYPDIVVGPVPASESAPAPREPWMMTRQEFVPSAELPKDWNSMMPTGSRHHKDARKIELSRRRYRAEGNSKLHRQAVADAIVAGKINSHPDYPELIAPAPKPRHLRLTLGHSRWQTIGKVA